MHVNANWFQILDICLMNYQSTGNYATSCLSLCTSYLFYNYSMLICLWISVIFKKSLTVI